MSDRSLTDRLPTHLVEAMLDPKWNPGYFDVMILAREVQESRAKLAAIDALHQPMPYAHLTVCCQCDVNWPCDTHRILHPTEVTE